MKLILIVFVKILPHTIMIKYIHHLQISQTLVQISILMIHTKKMIQITMMIHMMKMIHTKIIHMKMIHMMMIHMMMIHTKMIHMIMMIHMMEVRII